MSETPPTLQCHILTTGYCLAWEHHILQGGRHRRVACHSLAALLCHPEQGCKIRAALATQPLKCDGRTP